MTPQIDPQKCFPYLTVFQAQLDPGVFPAVSNGKVLEPVADLVKGITMDGSVCKNKSSVSGELNWVKSNEFCLV